MCFCLNWVYQVFKHMQNVQQMHHKWCTNTKWEMRTFQGGYDIIYSCTLPGSLVYQILWELYPIEWRETYILKAKTNFKVDFFQWYFIMIMGKWNKGTSWKKLIKWQGGYIVWLSIKLGTILNRWSCSPMLAFSLGDQGVDPWPSHTDDFKISTGSHFSANLWHIRDRVTTSLLGS